MSENIEIEALARQAAADAALALEIVGRFFGTQIEVGAVLREEIVLHFRHCASTAAEREPALATRIDAQATRLIDQLPAGWGGNDPDWVEPA